MNKHQLNNIRTGLESIYKRLESNEQFKSEEEAANWLSQAIPLLQQLDAKLHQDFIQNFQYLNSGLTITTTKAAFARLKNIIYQAIKISNPEVYEHILQSNKSNTANGKISSLIQWLAKPVGKIITGVITAVIAGLILLFIKWY